MCHIDYTNPFYNHPQTYQLSICKPQNFTEGFEKVSFEQYYSKRKEWITEEKAALEYLNIKIPTRATKGSAGYDFASPYFFKLIPQESIKISLGIKAFMGNNLKLEMLIRSSLAFKFDVSLSNCVGLIDSDYYGNIENEGHIMVKLTHKGEIGSPSLEVNAGDYICQGILGEYITTTNDIPRSEVRAGGIGSTDK